MVTIKGMFGVAVAALLLAIGISIAALGAIGFASTTGWLLSRLLPLTFFEATCMSLGAGSVVTLAGVRLYTCMADPAWTASERHEREEEEDEEAVAELARVIRGIPRVARRSRSQRRRG